MKKFILLSLVFFLFIAPAVFPTKALSANYYAGKTIRIIVSYSPGGGYDSIARIMARHLTKYIPGKPNIIIQNMPGAGSRIAASYLFNQAKPNGLTIGCLARSLPVSQLMKSPGIRFDMSKFSWLGSPLNTAIVLAIRSELPYKTFDELLRAKEPINIAATGVGLTDSWFPLSLQNYAGMKVNLVQYSGGAAVMLAIERKEADGWSGDYDRWKPYIKRGLVRPIIRGPVSVPGIENLPSTVDVVKSKKEKTIMALLTVCGKLGHAYVAPPNTPTDIMKILRQAFGKWTTDPEVNKEVNNLKMSVQPTFAKEALETVNFVLNQPPEIVEELGKFIKF